MLFKILLIAFIFFFLLFRVGGFFLRLLFGSFSTPRHHQSASQNSRKPKDGNVNIDHVPNDQEKKKPGNFDGGEYVDYEEVK